MESSHLHPSDAQNPAPEAFEAHLHPVLGCEQSKAYEADRLSSETAIKQAINAAGKAIGEALLKDFSECTTPIKPHKTPEKSALQAASKPSEANPNKHPEQSKATEPMHSKKLHILLLIGKGHNGADACIAAKNILKRFPKSRCCAPTENFPERFSKHTEAALESLRTASELELLPIETILKQSFDICIDGLLGMGFKPPLNQASTNLLNAINAHKAISLRAAVDLPSGLGAAQAFRADFTYATGIVKSPALNPEHTEQVGRLRYLDLGFFKHSEQNTNTPQLKTASHTALQTPAPSHPAKPAAEAEATLNPAPPSLKRHSQNPSPKPSSSDELAEISSSETPDKATHTSTPEPPARPAKQRKTTAEAAPAKAPNFRVSVLSNEALGELAEPRDFRKDKRHYGHLLLIGGSREMPGALMMNTLAALKSGVGLLSVFAPKFHAAAMAAQAPEAMWTPCTEGANGSLSANAFKSIHEKLSTISEKFSSINEASSINKKFSATGEASRQNVAVLIGSGMVMGTETESLTDALLRCCAVPLVLDASALHAKLSDSLKARDAAYPSVVLTPHRGEAARIGLKNFSDAALMAFSERHNATVLLKGPPVTRIAKAGHILHIPAGSPVLARGGSGDILAGMLASLLAQGHTAFKAAALAELWQARSSEQLARIQGHRSVRSTELIDQLGPTLQEY